MKSSFWLPARIAIIFILVMGVPLGGGFYLFRRTVTHHFRHEVMAQMLASRTALLALEVERRTAGVSIHSPMMGEELKTLAADRGVEMALLDGEQILISTARRHETWKPAQSRSMPCADRTCRISVEPPFPTFIPLTLGKQTVTLATTHAVPYTSGQRIFISGLLVISLLGLAGVVVFSVYLTRPLRRMSRSMDRIAGGDLDHRISVKGKDDVARMGRSFNAMADRVVLMVDNQKNLLAGISHELRSPLSRMKLTLEMLREAGAEEARVNAVDAEVDALDKLVDELLVISRLDLATATLIPKKIAVQDLVAEGWKRVAAAAEENQTLLEIAVQPDAGDLKVDRSLGVRILGNLFENAVRHGGGELVKVTARREKDRIVLTVSDRGPGVPSEALESLFEPFFRVDSSRSRRTGGTGIGLMIVRRAVEAHGGKVRAETARAGGLTVSFDLPAASQS